jgi:glycerol-3-phosphate O-acyltransferase
MSKATPIRVSGTESPDDSDAVSADAGRSSAAPVVPRKLSFDRMASVEARYRSGMVRRFGALYHLSGLGLLMRSLRLEEHSAENIRRASQAGTVVYMLHTRSLLDWVALNKMLNSRRLPLARYTHGLRTTMFQSGMAALSIWRSAIQRRLKVGVEPDPLATGWLSDAIAGGMTTCLFAVRPRILGTGRETAGPDPMDALLEAQRQSDRDIQVVPVVVIWKRRPRAARSEVERFVLGAEDEPGPLQKLAIVASRSNEAIVQAGQPVNMRELLERLEDEPPRRQARAARLLLRRYLWRETHTIRGPRIRPYRWVRRNVLSSPEVKEVVRVEAAETGRPPSVVLSQVERMLDKMSARMSFPFVRFADHFCRLLFTRIFNGVDMRPEDAERVREALRSGTPIIVPCHRSHLDYILISWVFWQNDLHIPHVCAGDNLSFWPLGPLLRRVGGFFIKRSFKGERLFPVVFERYMRQLIRDGFPIEFYLEGGRSRTGKLLPARHGVLSMVLDAASNLRRDRDVTFLPMSICYEQIAEAGAYARELGGEEKQIEDIGQVVRAGRVLRQRYGKVYLRVGEPLSAREIFAQQSTDWSELTREQRREALHQTGERLMYRIAERMIVLPTGLLATVLLAQSRPVLRSDEIQPRATRFLALLERKGAPTCNRDLLSEAVLVKALARFLRSRTVQRADKDGVRRIRVVPQGRISLEYYKNATIHFLAPASLLAACVRSALRQGGFDLAEILSQFQTLIFILRYELPFDPEASMDDLGAAALEDLVEYGAIESASDGTWKVSNAAWLDELAELTRNFVESYHLVLRAVGALRERDATRRDFVKQMQAWGRPRLGADELLRPEALSMVNLKNAWKAFREDGIVVVRTDGTGIELDEAAVASYRRLLHGFLV